MDIPKIHVIFVVNPISGGHNKAVFTEKIPVLAEKYNIAYQILYTKGEGDLMHLRNMIRSFRPEIVVAIGGDGTLLLVADAIMHTSMRLGIIPMGSANGMAAELKIPKDPEKALEVVFKGRTIAIDNLKVDHRYNCIHIGDMGLNAKIVKRFEEDKRRGLLGYARQFFRELPLSRQVRAVIQTDKARYVKGVHMIAFANARRYGTGAVLNPLGQLDDGYFELCVIKSLSFVALGYMLLSVFSGSVYKTRYARVIQCKEASIILRHKKKLTVQVDGEVIGERSRLHIAIQHKCLNVVVPNQTEPSFWDSLIAQGIEAG